MKKYSKAFLIWLAFDVSGLIVTHQYNQSHSAIGVLYLIKVIQSIATIWLIHYTFFEDSEEAKDERGRI